MHSFLEGDYERTGERGKRYNTSVWQRTLDLYYDEEFVPVYVWYYGEISDDVQWWVIAASNYSTAKENNGSQVYGYCPSITKSPAQCTACWNFYFSEENRGGAWHGDCDFTLDADKCPTVNTDPPQHEWPDYVCINGEIDSANEIDFEWNMLIGGYERKENVNFTEFSGNVPYWVKPPNDYNENSTYLYYDAFYGYWQVGPKMHVGAYIFCMEAEGENLPTHCSDWYDHHHPPHSLGKGFIFSDNCGREDMLTLSVQTRKPKAAVALMVLLLLALVALLLAMYVYWKHHQKKTMHQDTGGRRQSVELGDDVDKIGLVTHTAAGGMDMRPIYTEGNVITMDHEEDDDDLDEDYTTSKRASIVGPDDDGSEEELMADHETLGAEDDELRMPTDEQEDPDLDM